MYAVYVWLMVNPFVWGCAAVVVTGSGLGVKQGMLAFANLDVSFECAYSITQRISHVSKWGKGGVISV